MTGKMTRIPELYRLGLRVSGQHRRNAPRNTAADPEHEQSQPINREDRRAMLRRHFKAGGMTDAEIDAHLTRAKV